MTVWAEVSEADIGHVKPGMSAYFTTLSGGQRRWSSTVRQILPVPPKPLEHGHVIQVFGTPNMRTVLHCLPPRDWTEPGFMGLGMIYTALPVTNAVPAVVAAPPGIVTLRELPPVAGRLAR